MLTVHERLTAPGVLLTFHAVVLSHAESPCALTVCTTLARRFCNCRPGLHFSRNHHLRNPIRHLADPSTRKGQLAKIEIP